MLNTLAQQPVAQVAAKAHSVDAGETTTRQELADITAAGFAHLGDRSGRGSPLEQVAVIEVFAKKSLSVAFSLWCHRKTVDYLSTVGGPRAKALQAGYRAGHQIGSSARADVFRNAAGFGELLALRGTASTSVTVDDVLLSEDQTLTIDLRAFVRRVRPVLNLWQASFCLGVAIESFAQTRLFRPTEVFRSNLTQLSERLGQAKDQFVTLVPILGTDRAPSGHAVLALRLEDGLLAKEVTRSETMTAGNRAFVMTSDVNRRYPDATFIPLQTPSDAQLRAELTQESST